MCQLCSLNSFLHKFTNNCLRTAAPSIESHSFAPVVQSTINWALIRYRTILSSKADSISFFLEHTERSRVKNLGLFGLEIQIFSASEARKQNANIKVTVINSNFSLKPNEMKLLNLKFAQYQLIVNTLLRRGFVSSFSSQDNVLGHFCNVLLQNIVYIKQNIAEMSQDVVLGRKARYKIGR